VTVSPQPRADATVRVVPPADPLAELVRLRCGPGPWLHLLDGAPSDARQLGWPPGRDGVVVRMLRGHCLRTGYGLFDEAAAALQLPGDPVKDWHALATLLTDLAWLPGDGHVLVVTRAGRRPRPLRLPRRPGRRAPRRPWPSPPTPHSSRDPERTTASPVGWSTGPAARWRPRRRHRVDRRRGRAGARGRRRRRR